MRLAALLLLSIVFASCAVKNDKHHYDKPLLTVAIAPQKYLLATLAGDKFEIQTLLPPGADPESFEPSFDAMKCLMNSEAYFQIASLPFENQLIDKIRSNFPELRIISPPSGLYLIYGSHGDSHHHHGGENDCVYDPHYWTSIRNLRLMAADMANQLSILDPDAKDLYERRLSRLDIELNSLNDSINSILASSVGKEFLIWHPSLSYFAHDFGLSQIAVQHDGKDPDVAWLKHIYSLDKQMLTCFVIEPEHDARLSRSIASEMQIPVFQISVMSDNITNQLLKLAYEIARK